MMKKRHNPEQIVRKLREADALLSSGAKIADACIRLEVSEATYHRWRRQYSGMELQTLKRLKALEQENARLKRGCQIVCVNGLIIKRVTVPRKRWTDG